VPTAVTIGVMARAPLPGRCKTRLAPSLGDDGAAALYGAMLRDRIAAVSELPATRRLLVAAPEHDGVVVLRDLLPAGWEILEQRGADLGERLGNAFRDLVRPDASELVCLVDSDSPTLPFARLWPALAAERAPSTVVVGPCADGGYYLVGMRALETGVFAGIPWSTGGVLTATRERCAALGVHLAELDPWYDVDEEDDLARVATELAERPSVAPRTANCLRELLGDRFR
jgi:uncharacterized protein